MAAEKKKEEKRDAGSRSRKSKSRKVQRLELEEKGEIKDPRPRKRQRQGTQSRGAQLIEIKQQSDPSGWMGAVRKPKKAITKSLCSRARVSTRCAAAPRKECVEEEIQGQIRERFRHQQRKE